MLKRQLVKRAAAVRCSAWFGPGLEEIPAMLWPFAELVQKATIVAHVVTCGENLSEEEEDRLFTQMWNRCKRRNALLRKRWGNDPKAIRDGLMASTFNEAATVIRGGCQPICSGGLIRNHKRDTVPNLKQFIRHAHVDKRPSFQGRSRAWRINCGWTEPLRPRRSTIGESKRAPVSRGA